MTPTLVAAESTRMPSALPGQDDYYAHHRRRGSSMSQSNLPDQAKPSLSATYSPSRSDAFLPATMYNQARQAESLSSNSMNNLNEVRPNPQTFQPDQSTSQIQETEDPDDYYRQWQIGGPSEQLYMHQTSAVGKDGQQDGRQVNNLMQPAVEEADRRDSTPLSDTSRTQGNTPGLRSRKSSVKDLVAQINASAAEETPPLPMNAISRPSSRNISPVMLSSAQFEPNAKPRKNKEPSHLPVYSNGRRQITSVYSGLGVSDPRVHINHIDTTRKPLFGEIVLDTADFSDPGYDIQPARRRRGSEGSPIVTSNPFFRPDPAAPHQESIETPFMMKDFEHQTLSTQYGQTLPNTSYAQRRRANSESPLTPITGAANPHSFTATVPLSIELSPRIAGSRLPLPQKDLKAAPTTDTSTLDPPSTHPHEPRAASTASPKAKAKSSPRRKQHSPPQIHSPGRRGRTTETTLRPRSPPLHASIVVPPPKMSPTLRSSRPRMPVSSASTASSRARMAEKFAASQKMNDEKRHMTRRPARPPELSDIDLKARRLRITQALSRSLEGQDLRGSFEASQRRTASASRTDSSSPTPPLPTFAEKELRNATAAGSATERRVHVIGGSSDHAPMSPYKHSTMQAKQGMASQEDDSPTLGHSERLSPLQTGFLPKPNIYEPLSAVTVETEFDPEPQSALEPLSHLRNSFGRTHNGTTIMSDQAENTLDHSDEESVHLILRDTMYLDDSEAIRAGYRAGHNNMSEALMPRQTEDARSSWTSSFEGGLNDLDRREVSRLESSSPVHSDEEDDDDGSGTPPSSFYLGHQPQDDDETLRSTIASDAYTIVNVVLQQHSTNGIVDQQFLDEVYRRVLQTSPYDSRGSLNAKEIEQTCLEEIQNREENWRRSMILSSRRPSQRLPRSRGDNHLPGHSEDDGVEQIEIHIDGDLPIQPPNRHKYKSSLQSLEDWTDASPSISDWMQYAHGDTVRQFHSEETTPVTAGSGDHGYVTILEASQPPSNLRAPGRSPLSEDDDLYSSGKLPQVPSKSSPALSQANTGVSPHSSQLVEPPQVPRRVTSLALMPRTDSPSPSISTATTLNAGKASLDEPETPEYRKLKKRRHIMKELVDTEFTYEKDLRVLCDIYKQTASAALSDEDIKALFGNIEQVQDFSQTFLTALKAAAKPSYIMERPDRKKDKLSTESSTRPNSSSSTLASTKILDVELPNAERDWETTIGNAFEEHLSSMERVYAEYIRNIQPANQKLLYIQKSSAGREWLKECRDNSSDITNAWNLDALLVKPVQRITKYPLLLKELVDATANNHPDLERLRTTLKDVTEVNVRINEVKKQAELVDQVLNRKRKDSDVRIGLSKAFGRRAEKLKQHVGIAEMYEDAEYNEVKIQYDNNIVQLIVVSNDCSSYARAVSKWVGRMVEIASAAEAWIDVGHSNHQEAESKLRQFAMVTRGISTIALPDHLESLGARVLHPMKQATDLMQKFKNDPKGLLQKRDKRLIDYAQAKNKKDRGEKIDKKMTERMEQWEALNSESKNRMKKLVKATAQLVQACQGNLVHMQKNWLGMIKTKLSAAMGISLDHLDVADIRRDWQLDFDFQEASALSLSICNGSLLAETINMVNFQTPSLAQNGDNSPRQASFSSNAKRSVSIHSEGSQAHLVDLTGRPSSQYNRTGQDGATDRGQPHTSGLSSDGRERGGAVHSGSTGRISDQSSRNVVALKHASSGAANRAPQLSVETPSPLFESFQTDTRNQRPMSSSTFFSAAEVAHRTHHRSGSATVFSSAMPMSDSPVVERRPELPVQEPTVLFTAASVYEFNIDRSRREAGFPYLTYVTGEIFDIIGERGELWLARNQDDPQKQIGWIWNKHFAKLAT